MYAVQVHMMYDVIYVELSWLQRQVGQPEKTGRTRKAVIVGH